MATRWKCSLFVVLALFGQALGLVPDAASAADTASALTAPSTPLAMSATERRLRQQLAMSRTQYGDTSRETLDALTRLASFLSQDGFRSHELLPLVEELERISRALFGPEHTQLAFALQWQGLLLTALEDPQEALRRLERSLAIYRRAPQANAV